jgi:tetratricopeptide (TPR) repeat protein
MNKQESTLKVRTSISVNHNKAAVKPQKQVEIARKIFITMIMLSVLVMNLGMAVDSAKADQCTAAQGQAFIDAGQYKKAIQEFSCVIDNQPTEVEGYRGRIEAEVLLGQYSDAVLDYQQVNALVIPVHPDAKNTILAGYAARLAVDPHNMIALTGQSFAYWWNFDYPHAIQVLNHIVDLQPDSAYGNLFRGSSRLLAGTAKAKGVADMEKAIALDPNNPHVRFIAADAYTYGLPDPLRAFNEATLAFDGGLHTPRIHAILATSYEAFGDRLAAAEHIKAHIDLVTTEFVATTPITSGMTLKPYLVPGRTYEIPVSAIAGETISIETSSKDYWDSILVLLAPDGTPILGSDDTNGYFAAIDWTAEVTGIYTIQVTFFESVSFGELVVTRN